MAHSHNITFYAENADDALSQSLATDGSKRTGSAMDEHQFCPKCGFCVDCADCDVWGCGVWED